MFEEDGDDRNVENARSLFDWVMATPITSGERTF